MFVPVACLNCGKLFQVANASVGQNVDCPWCKATTLALPVAGVDSSDALSLDDALPPDPPREHAKGRLHREADRRPASSPPFSVKTILVVVAIVLVVSSSTVVFLRYFSASSSWVEFTPPDGSCTFALPGTPVAERFDTSSTGVTRGGERYSTSSWYSQTNVWVGWQDLDPGWAKQALLDRDGVITTPILRAERDSRKEKVGGKVLKEGEVRFNSYFGLELQMSTARGNWIERFILILESERPRLYFMGIESKNASLDSPDTQKLFNSFRIKKQ